MNVDLSTQYLGLTLRNPLVIAASPLTSELHKLLQFEQAGAAAAVMQSLFAEQIEHESALLHGYHRVGKDEHAENRLFVHDLDEYNAGPNSYLRHIEAAKKSVSIPIIGSLNGDHRGDWLRFARLIQDAGADALEVNIYFIPTDRHTTASQVEDRYVELVSAVRAEISIPLAVKIGPFFTAIPHVADRLVAAGADGLVLFNRFLQPDIDLATREVVPKLTLSTRDELRLPLRWIAILRHQLSVSLAASSGVHTADDALKLLLAGADVTMMASALIQHGPKHLGVMLDGMTHWLRQAGYKSVAQMKGSVCQSRCHDPSTFERANYIRAVTSLDEQHSP